jgi:membrane protein YqaA with SNARE-associated domain
MIKDLLKKFADWFKATKVGAWLIKYFKWWFILVLIVLGFAIIPNKSFSLVYGFIAGVAATVLVILFEKKFISK